MGIAPTSTPGRRCAEWWDFAPFGHEWTLCNNAGPSAWSATPSGRLGNHLRAIVRADVLRDAVGLHQISEHIDRVPGPDTPGDMNREAKVLG